MSPGRFYLYMLDQDHYEWAKWCNRMGGFNLSPDAEQGLATWFANAMMAMYDRPNKSYFEARISAEENETPKQIDEIFNLSFPKKD